MFPSNSNGQEILYWKDAGSGSAFGKVTHKGYLERLTHDSRATGSIWVMYRPSQVLPLYSAVLLVNKYLNLRMSLLYICCKFRYFVHINCNYIVNLDELIET